VVLKLIGVVSWSWWWVLSPFWGEFLLLFLLFVVLDNEGMMMSFQGGGPEDGVEAEPQEGFPAPDKVAFPDTMPGRSLLHVYERVSVEEGGRHVYEYVGVRTRQEWAE